MVAQGIDPGQIIQPDLSLEPAVPFSNLHNNQAVIIRIDPDSHAQAVVPNRVLLNSNQTTVSWIKALNAQSLAVKK
jgi:hypothetical protein